MAHTPGVDLEQNQQGSEIILCVLHQNPEADYSRIPIKPSFGTF